MTSPRSALKRNFEHILKTYPAKFERPLDEIWADYDVDNDGQLDKEQSKKFLDEVCKNIEEHRRKNYQKDKFDELYETYDDDKNGFLTKSEMG